MPPAQPTPLTRPDGTALRVLTVDDEPSLTELLAMAMRYEGWEVTTAATGTDAVHAARAVKPDAIVLDMMLPDFDGLEVMRRIRTEQPDVPVIFLTAKEGEGTLGEIPLIFSPEDDAPAPEELDELL